jgi:hypothetical protein
MSHRSVDRPRFSFMATAVDELRNQITVFTLTREDLRLVNPNTLTCPIFRTSFDADLTKKMYRAVPVLLNRMTGRDPWRISFLRMFDMSHDSGLFRNRPGHGLVPLYEAKMFWHFDHRWATHTDGEVSLCTDEQKASADFAVAPRYWVPKAEVDARLHDKTPNGWLLAFRNVTDSRNERSAVCALLPRTAVGNSAPLLISGAENPLLAACLLANLNSLVFDYLVRQKIAGMNLNFFLLEQLPVLVPDAYSAADTDFVGSSPKSVGTIRPC